ncbi:DUF1513 domain-containing protein [Roseibium sp. CAU 1637]|uniref:DUF1513 domain-containing protein n=1 Tax=Roseibium limicola TaxID=2816037 RepID=A0A939ER17_9HYPH|nr:DUF1513 domain-containing protein [Roseibium limicola]MBO0347084.1 DUF1513 domain-containing protein [Roseibium limicola]
MTDKAPRTEISRRALLAGLGGMAALSLQGFSASAAAAPLLETALLDTPLFASARRETDGRYALAIVDDAGQLLAKVGLPDRGHGMAISPDRRRIMAFARRPGTFALLIDPFEAREPQILAAAEGRHFYGHGCFSPDGRLVYAPENDYENVRGVVGVYDVSGRTIRRLGEIETHGVGPHDLLLMDDGKTMVVANGGIQTHPGRPREKLNIATMKPSVVYLDMQTGDLLARHELDTDLHQLSLRHMAKDAKGQIWVGGQFEGDLALAPPLVARMTRDSAPTLTQLPDTLATGLESYIGSVVANADGDVIATSAPRGNKVLFWSATSGELLATKDIQDGCGVAPIDAHSFLISDGTGALTYLEDVTRPADILSRANGIAWDNHMFRI